MNNTFTEARQWIEKARQALRRGDKATAWRMGEQAALLAPDTEDPWLILAASDPDPQEALAYAQKALEINPSSTRARRGVEWAKSQIKPAQIYQEALVVPQGIALRREPPLPAAKPQNRSLFFVGAILGLLMCTVLAFAAYSAVTHPAFASILNGAAVPTQADHWSAFEIAKPSVTAINPSAFADAASATPAAPKPTKAPAQPAATATATDVPTEAFTATPEITETPAPLAMEAVVDTPTSQYVAPQPSGQLPDIAKSGNGVRWIDVDLSNQAVYAYEGDVMVNSFIVSTGTWLHPTVVGQYKIYVKYRYANMHGPGYFLPDVPYVMYFYKGYGLHGTYWHSNFGTPMSHGCINLRTDDAGWLFQWASVGTTVNVHY